LFTSGASFSIAHEYSARNLNTVPAVENSGAYSQTREACMAADIGEMYSSCMPIIYVYCEYCLYYFLFFLYRLR